MLKYLVKTLRYLKLVEPTLNERKFLAHIGMSKEQIEMAIKEYNNADIHIQMF